MQLKIRRIIAVCFVVILVCVGCGEPEYDFEKMEKSLEETYGEDYQIEFENDTVYITRTYTMPKHGRTREEIANLSVEEFEKWSSGWWLMIGNEQTEYEDSFKEQGSDYEVLITYQVVDYYGNEIGLIDIHGAHFTLEDLRPYRTVGQ